MEADSLSRRLRTAEPQPTADRISLRESDVLLFEAINRHGPLPTNYLHALTRTHHRSLGHFQWKLTRFYNGSANTLSLLSRPPQQFQSLTARHQYLIYDLTKASRRLLQERGIGIIERGDPFLHRFMGACVSASMEHSCNEIGLRYISRAEILSRNNKPLAVDLCGRRLIPDDLFGLQYGDKSYRFFAVEIDRNTESIERKASGYSTFSSKLDAYVRMMQTKMFRECWGVPNLMVLTITTNQTHMLNIEAKLAKLAVAPYAERFLFKAKPEFGVNWKVPCVMADLAVEPWSRATTLFNISMP